jgi:uncharacterized protein with HEPN domain
MRDKVADEVRLKHILDAISEIEQYIKDSTIEDFTQKSMLKFASIKQLEIIGEAANHISDRTINNFPDIKWRSVIGLRNLLIHEYFGIDEQIIWNIIIYDIPKLKQQIKMVLDRL